MTAKADTRNNIIHGFKQNGMIDAEKAMYSDFEVMFATCRISISAKEYKLCVNSFLYLFQQYLKKGHVDNEVFEDLGFPVDQDADYQSICRDTTIQQESRQRAKTLTHEHQAQQRESRRLDILREINRN